MSFDFELIGGKRFVLCILVWMQTGLLQWWTKLDPAGMAYTAVMVGTVGAFITGVVLEKKHDKQPQP